MKHHLCAVLAAATLSASSAYSQDAAFGTDTDTAYAQLLWDIMIETEMAGDRAIRSFPYEGTDPHGMMLETFYTTAEVDGHSGPLVIKRNYGPEGVSVDEVLGNPDQHLDAVTIMFKREAGYDAENGDWFWAKYLPDGSLDKNPAGLQLAGRVAKGTDAGCIACHSGAAGEDYLFTTDHLAN
ncbi:cytochrome P460 family protein [Marivita sp. S2033]|uniref:cytochrome P460 family protein n=1 Tax=Marivita sp. S2033 TaxID=3373187 RepID=UPI00398239A2